MWMISRVNEQGGCRCPGGQVLRGLIQGKAVTYKHHLQKLKWQHHPPGEPVKVRV